MLAWLTISLSACAVRQPQTPDAFLRPTPVPAMQGETWRDVALWCLELEAAAMSCNADKAAIRKIYE